MKTRTRFSIHTGVVNVTHVAHKLIMSKTFKDVVIGTEHVHATSEYEYGSTTLEHEIEAVLGYLPSRIHAYWQGQDYQQTVEANNDKDDDGN